MKKTFFVMICFIFALFTDSFGIKTGEQKNYSKLIKSAEDRIYTLAVFDKVKPSQAQLQNLVPYMTRMHILHEDYDKERISALREQVVVFAEFKKEDIKNVGFSERVEKAAANANNKNKELQKNYYDKANTLAAEAQSVFAPEQIKVIQNPNKRVIVESFLNKNDVGKKYKKAVNKNVYTQPSKEKVLKDELGKIHKDEYGEQSEYAKFLDSSALWDTVCKKLGTGAPKISSSPNKINTLNGEEKLILIDGMDDDIVSLEEKVQELKADINILNLVNGLNISSEQAKQIIESVAKYDKEMEAFRGGIDKNSAEELIGLTNKSVSMLERGESIPQPLQKRIMELKKQVNMRKDFQQNISDTYVLQVVNVLTEPQKKVVETYKPCLVPPKNLRDPVRAGQAHDNGPSIKMLEKIRSTPKKAFEKRLDQIAEKSMSNVEEHQGKWEVSERAQKITYMKDLFKRAYYMSDVDFELNKDELAEEANCFSKKIMLENKLNSLDGQCEKNIHEKIRSNLMNPRIIPILEERITQNEKFSKTVSLAN